MSQPVPLAAWAVLVGVIAAMLAVDLLLHRQHREISFREAATWSGVWVAVGLAFGALLWVWRGGATAGDYYAGYLIEKALSIDNVFIFAMVFAAFAVPKEHQHKVLFWGVIGALVFRFLFILGGSALLTAVSWTAFLLGALLI